MARTGSGKTCAFLIPVLEKLNTQRRLQTGGKCRAVILSPTRELSLQTLKVLAKLATFTDLRSIGINGGEGMEKQFDALASKPDIIVATPGRLAHHLSEIPDFDLSGCQICVLDEADRLLEMGFALQIRQIATSMPEVCQKLLLSATMPRILIEFTKSGFITDPEVVRLDNDVSVSPELRISFVNCRSTEKDAALLHIIGIIEEDKASNMTNRTGLTLIFAATRHHVEYISNLLKASGVSTAMVYGTLDQEARKSNLAAFRAGTKPVLVVTDVAARGIDVPLIDHVIHYAFPPTPKLFIHRSGRAARAGRIGFCWSLVEPDELPYMVDLHLFLGRQVRGGNELSENSYTLDEMTPEMVHFGCLPERALVAEIDNVQRIMESEFTGSLEAESLRSMTRVCTNAMKQYRRTRPEASRAAVRRAKAILEGDATETGQRQGSTIFPHPLLKGVEVRRRPVGGDGGSQSALADDANLAARDEFLQHLSKHRPKETVFEAFATHGKRTNGVVSHVDRGRTTSVPKGAASQQAALRAMKDMRRQMRIQHGTAGSLTVAGSATATSVTEPSSGEASMMSTDVGNHGTITTKDVDVVDPEPLQRVVSVQTPKPSQSKKRLSKAERKRMKKGGKDPSGKAAKSNELQRAKTKRGADFRDDAHFIGNEPSEIVKAEENRERLVEAAMQPSSASFAKGTVGAALKLEEAAIDILGDEHADLARKRRMMRWDKSKRKYVKTTVGSELEGMSKTKKVRLESGQLVQANSIKLGELYHKWQKKTNQSIGRTGVFDEVLDAGNDGLQDDAAHPTVGKSTKGRGSGGSSQEKSASRIRKERAVKGKQRIKNMKKSDRAKFMASGKR